MSTSADAELPWYRTITPTQWKALWAAMLGWINGNLDRHIVATSDTLGGKARIAGRRISVEDIAIWHVRLGKTVDEICAEYDLSLAEVHAALAHYYDHQAEIERDINEGDAVMTALRNSAPSKLAKRLAERRGE